MKLLLDQALPKSALTFLGSRGVDAIHAADIELSGATDAEILTHAEREGRVVVTLDAHFHAFLVTKNLFAPSVLHLRIGSLRGEAFAAAILELPPSCLQALDAGAIVTVQGRRMTIKTLPLVR